MSQSRQEMAGFVHVLVTVTSDLCEARARRLLPARSRNRKRSKVVPHWRVGPTALRPTRQRVSPCSTPKTKGHDSTRWLLS